MVFQENDFSRELQNSEIMQGQIKEAIKDIQPDVDNCFLDCLKALNAQQLVKIIEKNYKNSDGSWKKRSEMRPTETTGHAYTTIVQCALKMLGHYTGEINAFYSSDVRASVRLFQEQNCFNDNSHVTVDGAVGPDTFRLIVEKLGGISTEPPAEEVVKNNLSDQGNNENANTTDQSKINTTENRNTENNITLKQMINMKSGEYAKKYPDRTVLGPWSIKIEKGGGRTELPVNVMKAIDITIANDSSEYAKIFFDQYQNDPTMYAYTFYKTMKGGGTSEQVFDTALQYTIKNNQLSNSITSFDEFGKGTFFERIIQDFDVLEYNVIFSKIASTEYGKKYLQKNIVENKKFIVNLDNKLVEDLGLRVEIERSREYGNVNKTQYVLDNKDIASL